MRDDDEQYDFSDAGHWMRIFTPVGSTALLDFVSDGKHKNRRELSQVKETNSL